MLVSVIVPCFNEQEVLGLSYERFTSALASMGEPYEILYVNDGSSDATLKMLEALAVSDSRVKVLSFSRNFGHQNAVSAALHHVTGDVAVIIDADLQDPPEVIVQLVERHKQTGANIVYAVRNSRQGEKWLKLLTAKLYYRLLNSLTDYPFPVDTGDFRLVDRLVIDTFRQFPEKHKYLRGLFSWMGFEQVPLHYDRCERAAGGTKYTFKKMFRLAKVGIFGFSKRPLKLAISLGFISILFAFAMLIWVLYMHFFEPQNVVSGWPSTVIIILFMGGTQLFTIGILGEYISNIFDETKNRPEYIIARKINI